MSAIAEPESADSSDRAESATAVQGEATTADIPDRGSGWILLLAALPAVVIGMAIRAWLPRSGADRRLARRLGPAGGPQGTARDSGPDDRPLDFPVLAIFPPLSDYADARYSLPFLPQLLMGLGAWLLLLPARARSSPWLVAVLPTVWALAFALPQLHHSVGWTVSDPDAPRAASSGNWTAGAFGIWVAIIGASTWWTTSRTGT